MIPMSSSWWSDELPEYMTEAEYYVLSEGISRTVEIVHGHVIKCESPTPQHNLIARRLSFALESARSPGGPCLRVETDVDVVLWRVPRFTFRRPGVVAYKCLDDPARKPTAQETASPSTAKEDLLDKRAQYAAAGIPMYLVVVLDDKYDIWEIGSSTSTPPLRLTGCTPCTARSSTSNSQSGLPSRFRTWSPPEQGRPRRPAAQVSGAPRGGAAGDGAAS